MPAPLGAGHPEVRELRRLLRSRRARDESARFVIEGPRVLAGRARPRCRARRGVRRPPRDADADVVVQCRVRGIGAVRVLAAGRRRATRRHRDAAGCVRPRACCAGPAPARSTAPTFVLVADRVSDPGNAGTLVRSAAAAGVGRNQPRCGIGRRLQSEGGACIGRRPVRCPDRGRQSDRGDPRAPRCRRRAPGRRRRPGRDARSTSSISPGRSRSSSATRSHGLGAVAARRPRHDPDGRGHRVAQRRDGRHRAVLRGAAPAPRRGSRAMTTVDAGSLAARAADDRAHGSRGRRARRRPRRARRGRARATSASAPSCSRSARRSRSAPPEERKEIGRALGDAQAAIEGRDRRAPRPRSPPRSAGAAAGPALDLTLGGRGYERGHLHLVTQVWRELEDIFVGLGYRVFGGPEVEDDWHNFEALNFPRRPSGARDAGHALREARRARAGDAAHAHVAGADPADGDAAAADLRGDAGPHLPARHARRAPLAGVPPDRGARRRPRHHDGRPHGHDRDVHPGALRRRRAHALPAVVLPVHRAVGRAVVLVPVLHRRLPRVLAHRMDRARRLRCRRPERVRPRAASIPRSTRASRSASASTGSRSCATRSTTSRRCSGRTTSASSGSSEITERPRDACPTVLDP